MHRPMPRRNEHHLHRANSRRFPPIELDDFRRFDDRTDELRIAQRNDVRRAISKPLDAPRVEVIPMIVRDEHDVDRG